MNSKQLKRIATHPKSYMDYKIYGRMPEMSGAKRTPLWLLLDKLPTRIRVAIGGVRLSPALGYMSNHQFANAQLLYNWLGGNSQHGSWEEPVSYRVCDQRFKKTLSVDDLLKHASRFPSREVFSKQGIDLRRS